MEQKNLSKQEIWWENLTQDVKDSVNKSIFYKEPFDLNLAYSKLALFIR